MERICTVASILCLGIAAILLLRQNYDGAFVLAALGAVAWFLNYRFRIRRMIDEGADITDDRTTSKDEE